MIATKRNDSLALETLFKQIERVIAREIKLGILKPGERLADLDSLAARWKVSPSTVRQSLQLLAAQGVVIRRPRVGTMVSHNALDLLDANPRTSNGVPNYAVFVPDLPAPEYATLVRGATRAASQMHAEVKLVYTNDDSVLYEKGISSSIEQGVAGMIIVPPLRSRLSLSTLQLIEESHVPTVACWRPIEPLPIPVVRSDPFEQLRTTTSYLASTGCRNIGFLTLGGVVWDHTTNPLSLHGYERALHEWKLPFTERHIFDAPIDWENDADHISSLPSKMWKHVESWLTDNPSIDGIACMNDVCAGLALRALHSLGRSVPNEVAVTGVGCFYPYFEQVVGSLTTLDVHVEEIAVRALKLLCAMQNGEKFPVGHVETIAATLVIGETTRPVVSH